MTSYHVDENRQTMLPGFNGTPNPPSPIAGRAKTSREAAASMAEIAPNQRMRIFEFVARLGANGATRDEISASLGMAAPSVGPRVLELINLKMLRESEQRRPTRSGRSAKILFVRADR
jgi:hypothetical protein